MTARPPDRDAAWELVCQHTASLSLRRHMLAVEAAMRHYARLRGEDEMLWACVGLLHDFDYEAHPEGHPLTGEPILAAAGWPEQVRRAILSHADNGAVPRVNPLELGLHACDEITGLIIATALVRPDRDLRQVTLTSVMKKWRNPAFAAGVDRDEMARAAEAFGMPLEAHVGEVLAAMQAVARELGLSGA